MTRRAPLLSADQPMHQLFGASDQHDFSCSLDRRVSLTFGGARRVDRLAVRYPALAELDLNQWSLKLALMRRRQA